MERKITIVYTGVQVKPDELPFKRYRKKPVIVEAFRTTDVLDIVTLEGTMRANHGDWIIKGVEGEIYPCKPNIFEATYEPV